MYTCVLTVSDFSIDCVFTGFTVFHGQHLGDLKRGGGIEGKGDVLPIIWCCLSGIIPPFQMEGNADEATEQNNWRQREREKEKMRDCPFLYRISVNSWQGKTSLLQEVSFQGLHFDWISILMKDGDAPKLYLNPSRNCQLSIVFFVIMQLLPCTCKETKMIVFLSLQHKKRYSSPLSV